MGYKGTIRTIGAAVRQMERDAIRRQKELERQRKQYEKMQELERARYEVEVYENYIDRITSLQRDCSPEYNWEELAKMAPPVEPINPKKNEKYYQSILNKYKPSLIDKIFKLQGKKTLKLNEKVNDAIQQDNEEYSKLLNKYKEKLSEYENIIDVSRNVLNGDIEYYKQVINDVSPFSEISELGSEVNIEYLSKNKVKSDFIIHDENIIPKESKTLLQSGKLSSKNLPVGKYYELYQDYICSASLRIARELFALIPIEENICTAKGYVLNTSTGRKELVPLLSVLFVRETMENINFNLIDPSDCMSNFKHNMNFKKTKGMLPINEIS